MVDTPQLSYIFPPPPPFAAMAVSFVRAAAAALLLSGCAADDRLLCNINNPDYTVQNGYITTWSCSQSPQATSMAWSISNPYGWVMSYFSASGGNPCTGQISAWQPEGTIITHTMRNGTIANIACVEFPCCIRFRCERENSGDCACVWAPHALTQRARGDAPTLQTTFLGSCRHLGIKAQFFNALANDGTVRVWDISDNNSSVAEEIEVVPTEEMAPTEDVAE